MSNCYIVKLVNGLEEYKKTKHEGQKANHEIKREYGMKRDRLKMRQKGFTLLELLIVLVIMGFLLAMVVPRLAKIGSKAVETIGETNIRDIRRYVISFQQQYNRLPDKLISLVNSTKGVGYQLPEIDDLDTENGPETISWDFDERNKLCLHILNYEEATELIKMGIRRVAILNDHKGSKTQDFAAGSIGRPMNLVEVKEGLGVVMIGAGANSTTGALDVSRIRVNERFCNPEWIYRIILGIGPDSELVTKGIIQDAALSPGGIQASDFYTYNYYNVVLPRLKATTDRLRTGNPSVITVQDASDPDYGKEKEIDIAQAQEPWEIDVVSPQGQRWSTEEIDMWRIRRINETIRH